jgi:hypothetical protein
MRLVLQVLPVFSAARRAARVCPHAFERHPKRLTRQSDDTNDEQVHREGLKLARQALDQQIEFLN